MWCVGQWLYSLYVQNQLCTLLHQHVCTFIKLTNETLNIQKNVTVGYHWCAFKCATLKHIPFSKLEQSKCNAYWTFGFEIQTFCTLYLMKFIISQPFFSIECRIVQIKCKFIELFGAHFNKYCLYHVLHRVLIRTFLIFSTYVWVFLDILESYQKYNIEMNLT